jgi:hypothetical protein
MAKKVLNIFKKISKAYLEGVDQLYRPLIEVGINPIN